MYSTYLYKLLVFLAVILLHNPIVVGHTDRASNEIPFVEDQGFILVEALLNGQPGEFVLDTGTEGLIVNNPTAKGPTAEFGTISKSVYLTEMDVGSFALASRSWVDIDAHALDLAFLEKQLSRDISGIVGISFVLPERILIDYERGVIRVNEATNEGSAEMQLIGRIPIVWPENGVPTLLCEIDGRKYRLGIDSGAGQNILFGRKTKRLIQKKKQSADECQVQMPDGTKLQTEIFRPDEFRLDNVNIEKSSFLLHKKNNLPNSGLDGLINLYLLGFDQFIIDTKEQQLLLFRRLAYSD